MNQVQNRFELPLLESIQIASPCSADWEAMQGDDRVRFCGECRLHVFNLSNMSRDEAEKLVRERTGRLCVRYYQRSDGTVLTADCPVGLAKLRKRLVSLCLMGATLTVSLLIGSLAIASHAVGLRKSVFGGQKCDSIFSRWQAPDPNWQVVQGGCPAPPVTQPPPIQGKLAAPNNAPN